MMLNKQMAVRQKIRVGLLGESPNDTAAIKALLNQRYEAQAVFFPLLEGLTGGTLDSNKVLRALPLACDRRQPDVIVVIRDLDGFDDFGPQWDDRQQYFARINRVIGGIGLYLLNIYELEALITAHIEVFNAHYNANCRVKPDVMRIAKPKEVLTNATQRCRQTYHESHSPALLGKVEYDRLLKGCRYFRDFDDAFAARLNPPKRHA